MMTHVKVQTRRMDSTSWCVYGYASGLSSTLIEDGFRSEGEAWMWIHNVLGISWIATKKEG
jgi:hypothetical protein